MIFSHEEFYDYFVIKELDNLKYLKRLMPYLPLDVANRLYGLYKRNKGLSCNLFANVTNINEDGRNIPYFNREKYYQLQSILLNSKLPIFYLSDFTKLSNKVSDKSYEIILTSNIFDWLYKDLEVGSVDIYKELLEKFKYSEIQALYCWNGLDNDLRLELMRNKFEIEEVPSAGRLSLTDKNIIVSLRRHK